MPPPVLAIVGATATGKSALGMSLAKALGGEIVNADALQVYRGFDIGTAKPSAGEREQVPHHLVDILDADERYSAGEFARRAGAAIAEILGRGRVPIVVGGSGLYLRALFSGISPIPPGDPAVRARLRQRAGAEGLPVLAAELAALDPETAARLAPADSQRILRALEVALVSGVPMSAWIARQPFGIQGIAAIQVGLTVPRGILYDRIASRVRAMVGRGWIEEVAGLLGRGLAPSLPAFQAIGYRQLARHLVVGQSLDAALQETVQATRRFAKRQETWFRKEPGVTWFAVEDDVDFLTSRVLATIRERGL
jgi:tRNA dimethylallyltransferase